MLCDESELLIVCFVSCEIVHTANAQRQPTTLKLTVRDNLPELSTDLVAALAGLDVNLQAKAGEMQLRNSSSTSLCGG
jgi:hypothetical protein